MDLSVARVTHACRKNRRGRDVYVAMGVPCGGYTKGSVVMSRRGIVCEVTLQAWQKTPPHFLQCYRKGRRFRT
jgi:hypothetical protein